MLLYRMCPLNWISVISMGHITTFHLPVRRSGLPLTLTAFSWVLTVDGINIPANRLANIRVSSAMSGLGLKGISRATLSCDILLNEETFSQSATCVLSDSEERFDFPDFYIYSRLKKGNILTISAIDGMIRTGAPFDWTGLAVDDDDNVFVSNVMMAIASQCGFDGTSYNGGSVTKLPLSYVKNKTCETILSDLSALMGGFWICSNSNQLQLAQWGVPTSVLTVNSNSVIVTSSEKGPISRIAATDSISKAVFDSIGSGDFTETIKTSADYMTSEQASSILSAYDNKSYYGWSCKCDCSSVPQLGGMFDSKPIGRYTLYPHIGGLGAEVGASDYAEPEWDFYGTLQTEINSKIARNEINGNVVITADGISLVGRYD